MGRKYTHMHTQSPIPPPPPTTLASSKVPLTHSLTHSQIHVGTPSAQTRVPQLSSSFLL
ncbi:unnamed protein product [Periconia digitata]|uniref:Uncharacterized protein n=1 Tax=Periconia digitata TaxID=1303443 RepID=A0A9W4UP12_9PLEO|nr:unnamed protein product [Periconia digitata]